MASNNGKSGRSVALVGGGALLLWLLLRGKGWGLGAGGEGGANAASAGANAVPEAPSLPRLPCKVFIRSRQIDLDGAPADLPTIVARCRASGRAHVEATGGASIQAVEDVVRTLQTAGVTVAASSDVWRIAKSAARRKP